MEVDAALFALVSVLYQEVLVWEQEIRGRAPCFAWPGGKRCQVREIKS